MGPYQGDLVKASDITAETDTSYMWEVTNFTHTLFTQTNYESRSQVLTSPPLCLTRTEDKINLSQEIKTQ